MKPLLPHMRTAVAALALLLLCGCSLLKEIHDAQQIENWAKDNEPLAESGQLKWSQFYTQYLEKAAATPGSDQNRMTERLGILLSASRLYEDGRLDRVGFDSVRRVARTYQRVDGPAANRLAREALVRALDEPRPVGPEPNAAR